MNSNPFQIYKVNIQLCSSIMESVASVEIIRTVRPMLDNLRNVSG